MARGDPVEFTRNPLTADSPERQRCGNKVQLEDSSLEEITAFGVKADSAWTILLNSVVMNATLQRWSAPMDISGKSAVWLDIYIESDGAPTNVRILPQFDSQLPGGWADFEEGLFASLMWEDTDTATGITKTFLLPCGGRDSLRVTVISVGTNGAGLEFTVSVRARPFIGNFGVAHA